MYAICDKFHENWHGWFLLNTYMCDFDDFKIW
jgi:hypothetical protein